TSGVRGVTPTAASSAPVAWAGGGGRGPRTRWRPERSRRARPERVDESRGHVRAPAPGSPDLGDRPMQLALRLLHAGRGVRLAAAGADPPLRGAGRARRRLHGPG